MRIPGFVFDRRLYHVAGTVVWGGVREQDRAPVVGKMVMGGLRDLQAESAILHKLHGAGIAECLGVFHGSDGPALIQRLFGTSTLAEAIAAGPLGTDRFLHVAVQLAAVLARVHDARILHRDVKPDNILYDAATGEIALADFGIAAELPVNARSLPVRDLVGTPSYVSPEQTGRTREGCDFRSDLYSAGVSLYRVATGRLPFESNDLLELVSAHLSRVPEPPTLSNPALPEMLSAIIMKLCAKSPGERYQSARGLLADLERCGQARASTGSIPKFELGLSDLLRVRVPDRLLGRDAEQQALSGAYARASGGKPSLVLVSGREGSGRRALVQALLRANPDAPAAVGRWTAAGERPLAGIDGALTSLASALLMLEDDRLAAIRKNVSDRVHPIGGVLIDLGPALADVLGPQPQVPALGPAEARARLRYAFRRLLAGLGTDQACVLTLNGFEHADAASLSLIEAVFEEPGSRVLVVLSALEQSSFGALVQHPAALSIELGPLGPAAVASWVKGALGCNGAGASELSAVLHDKSGGHPAVLASLLDHLVEQGVIERREGAFSWSLAAVRAAKAPPTLAALVSQRVAELPELERDLLAGLASTGDECELDALTAMVAKDRELVGKTLEGLERAGLVASSPHGFGIAIPAVAVAATSAVEASRLRSMVARLGVHLLDTTAEGDLARKAFHAAQVLRAGDPALTGTQRIRAARLCSHAGAVATRSLAYDTAAQLFEHGQSLLDEETLETDLGFELAIGHGRSLMMLGQNPRAEEVLKALCSRKLTSKQLGAVYCSRIDNRSVVGDRPGAIDAGIEGLSRLGIQLESQPAAPPLPLLFANDVALSKLSDQDHLSRPLATDERVIAALWILSTILNPVFLSRRTNLYLLVAETAISLILEYGHTAQVSGFLCTHSLVMHGALKKYESARRTYEASLALEKARPAPDLLGRTTIVLYYMLHPWFASWREACDELAKGVQRAAEAGDPLFEALCASSTINLNAMSGTPLDALVALYEEFASTLKIDSGLAAASGAARLIVAKLAAGEPVLQGDLDRLTKMPAEAGALRMLPMVNYGLALAAVGHEPQVRAWLDEIRDSFDKVCMGMPQIGSLWLLDGIFAAKDARAGQPERLRETERMAGVMRKLQGETRVTNYAASIALLDAEVARTTGDLERASGLYGRAATEARRRGLIHLVAYSMQERATMLEEAGAHDEAALFYRESVIAYRRWGLVARVQELEKQHPELRAMELSRAGFDQPNEKQTIEKEAREGGTRGHTFKTGRDAPTATTRSVNESIDLTTVLKVSRDISTQLVGSDVVRTVLQGIGQNAGAERVLFILREQSGADSVYGELRGGAYEDLGVPLAEYPGVPRTVVNLLRRTGKPVVIGDASSDPAHASDPFVTASRCRSVAGIPILRKGEVTGFVVLENRLVTGAFTPPLIGLVQALVSQAAISLDNASLYANMESRVRERTAALHARNVEMRLVLDNVVQGLAIIDLGGNLSSESSSVLREWYPEGLPQTIGGFFADDPDDQMAFSNGWEQLTDGLMPLELCIDQLPKRLHRNGSTFALSWEPIENDAGEVARILVVMSDITATLRNQEAEAEQRQQMELFQRLATDRDGVVEFIKEASGIVRELEKATHGGEVERRLVHTLKGNAGFFGLVGIVTLCHELESTLIEERRNLLPEERARVAKTWNSLIARMRPFLEAGDDVVHVRKADYDAAVRALQRDASPVAGDLELWLLEPLEARLHRIGEQAKDLAERLEKGPLRVQVDHGDVRVHAGVWAPFWSVLVHAVRNAIDHGIEPAAEREALGKGTGTLRLSAYFSGAGFTLEVADDGRGIPWDKLRERARERGLPAERHDDLVAALFQDGVSTKDAASETSGRGVGMSALKDVCEAMNAQVTVESAAGRGTTWRFTFPSKLARQSRRQVTYRPSVLPTSN